MAGISRGEAARRHGAGTRSGKKRIEIAEKHHHWFELRKQGLNLPQIAEACKGTPYAGTKPAIYQAIVRAIDRLVTPGAEAMRQLEAERIDELQRAYWKNALLGDTAAAAFCLKCIMERCKLYGLPLAPPEQPTVNIAIGTQQPSQLEQLSLEDVLPLLEAAGYEVRQKATQNQPLLTTGESPDDVPEKG
jgi:hypothetical protein